MPGFEHGVRRALVELIYSSLLGVIVRATSMIIRLTYLAEAIFLLLSIASIVDINKMKFWSTGYLVGYLLIQLFIASVSPDPSSIIIILMGLFIIIGRLIRYAI